MGKGLTGAQRAAVVGADEGTGRLGARVEVCLRLVAAGLAVPHGRGGHHAYYLTSEGRRVRAELAAKGAGKDREPDREPVREQGGGFVADDGSGKVAPSPRRAAEVAAAWEGLLQIRRVLMDGAVDRPAPWERDRCVHAVCLALEATGCPPARPERAGYTVAEGPDPDTARAAWTGPDATGPLLRMAALLADRGWQATDHRTRDGEPFLLISPRR